MKMKKEILKYIKLMTGLIICAFGIVSILNSDLGLSPWDVLNQGLNKQIGITMGQANIGVGIIVILIGLYFKQPLGSGTILNVTFVGIFIDLFMFANIIPWGDTPIKQFLLFTEGIIVFALGSYMYISAGCGCGPRDGLMVVFTKKTGLSMGTIRLCLEVFALTVGYFLGGKVGIGTAVFSLGAGYLIQFFFKIFKEDVKKIEHRSIINEIKTFRAYVIKKRYILNYVNIKNIIK